MHIGALLHSPKYPYEALDGLELIAKYSCESAKDPTMRNEAMTDDPLPASFLADLLNDFDPGPDFAVQDGLWDLRSQIGSLQSAQVSWDACLAHKPGARAPALCLLYACEVCARSWWHISDEFSMCDCVFQPSLFRAHQSCNMSRTSRTRQLYCQVRSPNSSGHSNSSYSRRTRIRTRNNSCPLRIIRGPEHHLEQSRQLTPYRSTRQRM